MDAHGDFLVVGSGIAAALPVSDVMEDTMLGTGGIPFHAPPTCGI